LSLLFLHLLTHRVVSVHETLIKGIVLKLYGNSFHRLMKWPKREQPPSSTLTGGITF